MMGGWDWILILMSLYHKVGIESKHIRIVLGKSNVSYKCSNRYGNTYNSGIQRKQCFAMSGAQRSL